MPATRLKIGGTFSNRLPKCDCNVGRRVPSFAVTSFDQVHDRLSDLAHLSSPVARAFADAGFSLYAVGGSVRDAILGEERREDFEIDFTTNARPDDIVALMTPLCSTMSFLPLKVAIWRKSSAARFSIAPR